MNKNDNEHGIEVLSNLQESMNFTNRPEVTMDEKNETPYAKPAFDYIFLNALLTKSLTIPEYQRPYRWQPKHVLQLLEDIHRNSQEKKVYRIGTTILHRNKETFDIVDGQQRLVTISLIFLYLRECGHEMIESPLLKSEFNHIDSRTNILRNYATIKAFFSSKGGINAKQFGDYMLHSCQFVEIVLTDLSEAFQLFDSQNARGRSLQPYDLLKAFHLREMKDETEAERRACVGAWEDAVARGWLNNLGKYIFRIRKWVRGGKPGEFNKEHIGEFKGVNFDDAVSLPYMQPLIMSGVLLSDMAQSPVYKTFGNPCQFPFQLTQPIVNGRLFFKLVEHYNKKYNMLFEEDSKVKNFFKRHCKYDGHHRIGDRYVAELFKALIILYHDRFGDSGLEEALPVLYKWSYRLRLNRKRVFYNSIDSHVGADNIFKVMTSSYYPQRIINLPIDIGEIKYDVLAIKNVFNLK